MSRPGRLPLYAAAMIERADNHVLIVRSAGDPGSALWRFPGGAAGPGESAEEAMRRIAREQLGIEVEIVVGQPPLTAKVGAETMELRFFFCSIVVGEPHSTVYSDLRWVAKAQLREYDFDALSRPVADWLAGE